MQNDISFLTQQFFQDKAVDTGKENADTLKKNLENSDLVQEIRKNNVQKEDRYEPKEGNA